MYIFVCMYVLMWVCKHVCMYACYTIPISVASMMRTAATLSHKDICHHYLTSYSTLVLKPKQVGPKTAEDFIFDFERECCLVLRSAYCSIQKIWLFRQSAKI